MPDYIVNILYVALGIVGLIIIWSLFKERLSLQYVMQHTDSVLREGEPVDFFNCWITNNGNRDLENISLKIFINSGELYSVKYINYELLRINDPGSAPIDVTVPFLKESEKVGALVSVKNPGKKFPLKIEARAGKVIARERVMDSPYEFMGH